MFLCLIIQILFTCVLFSPTLFSFPDYLVDVFKPSVFLSSLLHPTVCLLEWLPHVFLGLDKFWTLISLYDFEICNEYSIKVSFFQFEVQSSVKIKNIYAYYQKAWFVILLTKVFCVSAANFISQLQQGVINFKNEPWLKSLCSNSITFSHFKNEN